MARHRTGSTSWSEAGTLGANTALEDAASLAGRLAVSAPIDAIRAYEMDLRTRANRAIQLSQDGMRRLLG